MEPVHVYNSDYLHDVYLTTPVLLMHVHIDEKIARVIFHCPLQYYSYYRAYNMF